MYQEKSDIIPEYPEESIEVQYHTAAVNIFLWSSEK